MMNGTTEGFVRSIHIVCLAALLAAANPAPAGTEAGAKVRGIVISTHTDGREWGQDAISGTLEDIRAVGAGWVSTHPYAAIRADGSVRFRPIDPDDPPEWLVRPIREAHARGLKIMIKPHLAYWGSPFAWRGEIEFDSDEAWNRFWAQYTDWIVQVARACRDADGFVVGTELDRTLRFENRWRDLVAKVRGVTGAALTYAANWPDYQRVPFWDAVDVVGIQAYFPVADAPSGRAAVLDAGWADRMDELRRYAAEVNRRVVFTELGYNRAHEAAVRPWGYDTDGPDAEPVQEACLRAALRAFEAEPAVVGVFLWKWFPNPRPVGRTFQLATPRLKTAIRDHWR